MWPGTHLPFQRRYKMDQRPSSASVDIPIWVDGTQKWLTGLTKRTTCDDIIYALLSTECSDELDYAHTYAIYERWRDVERPLQGRTKILKVWKAWGIEQRNVKLQLQKFEDLHYSVEWVRTRKRHLRRSRSRSSSSKGSICKCPHCSCNDKGGLHKPKSLDSLVETVLSQEEKIQTLYRRIQETDRLIESHETRTHQHRVQHNGQNYVQDAYLESLSDESCEDLTAGLDPAALEQYLKVCDSIIHIEDRIMEEREQIQNLSVTLNQEMDNLSESSGSAHDLRKASLRFGWNFTDSAHPVTPGETPRDLQTEINRSMASNLDHGIHLENLGKEIRLCNQEWQQKKALLESLIGELEMVQNTPQIDLMVREPAWTVREPAWTVYDHDNNAVLGNLYHNPYYHTQTPEKNIPSYNNMNMTRNENIQVIKQRGITIENSLYTHSKQEDNDSDTGLSSMHSDESPSALETLV